MGDNAECLYIDLRPVIMPHQDIKTKVMKSCKMQYVVAGDRFYVKASHLIYERWKVHTCICRENDNALCIPMRAMYINKRSLRSPFTGKWIGHILRSHLETMPGVNYPPIQLDTYLYPSTQTFLTSYYDPPFPLPLVIAITLAMTLPP